MEMEDSEPIRETEQAPFCVEILKRLNTQRGQGYLCDIILVTKKGNEFKAHRNVLSAATPFFAKLLQSEMKEKEEGVIRFENISASILEEVLEFIYTGKVKIDDERKAKDLIMAADYLLLVSLKTVAEQFLEKQLTDSNCITTFYFAQMYQCEGLVASSRELILEHFASVAESDAFLNLEAEQVGNWISSDDICVADEEDVLNIIQKWIEQNESDRKAKFEELFRHVRLDFVSRDSLLDVVTHRMVRRNHTCLEKVSDAVRSVSGASQDAFVQSPRRRLLTHAIVTCGGKHTLCYLPHSNEWKFLADSTEDRNQETQLIIFHDQLCTFKGYGTERFDPVFNSWASVEDLRLFSYSKRLAVVRGQLYAIDFYRRTALSTIKRYNAGSWSWESILTSHEGCRDESCVVAAGNCLYVLGGRALQSRGTRSQYVAKAERFDTVHGKWASVADMQQKRGCAFGVATQGKIFVAGGRSSCYDSGRGLQTCEVYSISTNEWQFIGSLNFPRLCGSMVCVNGTLYVLGGSRGAYGSPEYTVESYNETADGWTHITSIPVYKIPGDKKRSFKGCALKLPKGVLDKPSISKRIVLR